ncbi:MAG: DUF4405 domain-containing protein [Propionibacteriaceae bacterium]|nr:DUF4405 domain-containing protein [Propionibacteriaceae bacterium]
MAVREIAGSTLAGAFIFHCPINRKWIASISVRFFTTRVPSRVRVQYVCSCLLVVAFLLLLLSGIMTSQVLFSAIAAPKGSSWRGIHHCFAVGDSRTVIEGDEHDSFSAAHGWGL